MNIFLSLHESMVCIPQAVTMTKAPEIQQGARRGACHDGTHILMRTQMIRLQNVCKQ